MTPEATGATTRRVSDDAVRRKTGRGWNEWFTLLDQTGAAERSHRDIAASLLKSFPQIGGWWAQMITVAYEQERGQRIVHQRPDGYEIGVSRTIAASPERLFPLIAEAVRRRAWLSDSSLRITSRTPPHRLRGSWGDARLTVDLTPKRLASGAERTVVVVQVARLTDAAEAERAKAHWREALDRLRERASL